MNEKKVAEEMADEGLAAAAEASMMALLGGGTDQKTYMDFQDVLGPKTGQGQPVTAHIKTKRGRLTAGLLFRTPSPLEQGLGFPASDFGFQVHSKKDVEGARLLLQEAGEAINKFLSAAHIALDEYQERAEKDQALADATLKRSVERMDKEAGACAGE